MKRTLRINKECMNAVLPPIPADFEREMKDLILSMPAETPQREEKTVKRTFSSPRP